MQAQLIKSGILSSQRGALIIVTLLILLVVSMLGMATMDTTGLEMQMSSNSRAQQQAFEAAEYTLSWVEDTIKPKDYFAPDMLENLSCGATCFDSNCTNGYCFNGTLPNDPDPGDCKVMRNPPVPVVENYASEALWATGSGRHRTLAIPGTDITAKYIIEYWCYTTRYDDVPYHKDNNSTRMFRITAYVVGEGGRARVMLRSSMKQI